MNLPSRESILFPGYEAHVISRLAFGRYPYSLQTYVKYNVRGAAAKYADKYLKALVNACNRRGWIACRSEKQGKALVPAHMVSAKDAK